MPRVAIVSLFAALPAIGIAACGGSSDPTPFAVKLTGSGKGSAMSAPKSVKGPLVEMTFTNESKGPGDAQLVRFEKGHSVDEVLKEIGSEDTDIPDWLHGAGGVGDVKPGKSGTTTAKLDPGSYIVVNDSAQGKPPVAEFTVEGGNDGDLPGTDATVTAAEVGKDKYEWKVDGLKAGDNRITFDSEGKEALHHIVAAQITGDATIDDVKTFLDTEKGKPPISEENSDSTAVIDGERSEVTTLTLKPGRYAFLCFLSDREKNAKPHFKEGLIKEVTIK
jgi:hypothetical protein